MKLLSLLLIAGVISGCACRGIQRPTIEICVIDAKTQQCACNIVNPDQMNTVSYFEVAGNVLTRTAVRHPLSYCHKAVAMRPPEWEKAENYRNDLEVCLRNPSSAVPCQ